MYARSAVTPVQHRSLQQGSQSTASASMRSPAPASPPSASLPTAPPTSKEKKLLKKEEKDRAAREKERIKVAAKEHKAAMKRAPRKTDDRSATPSATHVGERISSKPDVRRASQMPVDPRLAGAEVSTLNTAASPPQWTVSADHRQVPLVQRPTSQQPMMRPVPQHMQQQFQFQQQQQQPQRTQQQHQRQPQQQQQQHNGGVSPNMPRGPLPPVPDRSQMRISMPPDTKRNTNSAYSKVNKYASNGQAASHPVFTNQPSSMGPNSPNELGKDAVMATSSSEGGNSSSSTADRVRPGSSGTATSVEGDQASSSVLTSDELSSATRNSPPSLHRARPTRDNEREERAQSRLSMTLDMETATKGTDETAFSSAESGSVAPRSMTSAQSGILSAPSQQSHQQQVNPRVSE